MPVPRTWVKLRTVTTGNLPPNYFKAFDALKIPPEVQQLGGRFRLVIHHPEPRDSQDRKYYAILYPSKRIEQKLKAHPSFNKWNGTYITYLPYENEMLQSQDEIEDFGKFILIWVEDHCFIYLAK